MNGVPDDVFRYAAKVWFAKINQAAKSSRQNLPLENPSAEFAASTRLAVDYSNISWGFQTKTTAEMKAEDAKLRAAEYQVCHYHKNKKTKISDLV